MRSILLPGVLVAGLGFLSACGSSTDNAPPADVTLELATWWTGMSEINAINALLDVHKAAHPEVKVKTLSAASQTELQSTITNRFTTGNPPAAFQANLGGSALTWGPSAQSLNTSSSKWTSSFPQGVLEQLTFDGSLIGVPLALTRQNAAYWNLKVLNTITFPTDHAKIPSTIDELNTWLTDVSGAGYTHPLCFGGKDSWVVAHVMFEDILPAVVGAEFSKTYWGGKTDANDPMLVKALDYAKSIMPYLSTDWIDMDMGAGINKVMNADAPEAQCLMTSMGDWGGAILADAMNTPAIDGNGAGDFTGTGWPAVGGSARVVFGGDTFVAARGAANQQAVFDFFDTMASEAGQISFNKIKGSMPARIVAQDKRADFGTLTRKNMDDLEVGGGLAGFKLIGKAAFPFDAMSDVVRDFFQTKDSTTLLAYLKDNYSKLK